MAELTTAAIRPGPHIVSFAATGMAESRISNTAAGRRSHSAYMVTVRSTLTRLLRSGLAAPPPECSVCGRSLAGEAVLRIRGVSLHHDCVGYRARHALREDRRRPL